MYLEHYSFRDRPFRLNHDPAYYYGEVHQVPLNELCYSIEERHGLAILLGEAGTGKTTLLLRLVRSFADHLQGIFLSDMAVADTSLLRQIARALKIPYKPQDSTEAVTQYLDIFLRGKATAGQTVVILLDEAQSLSNDQFEELRYLTNIEHRGQRLVEIILAGLPSLERRLRDPDLEAVNQRATVRCWVEPFNREQMKSYIHHRLHVVRAPNPNLFTEAALDRVYMASRGIPRLINIICERSLLVGYVDETHVLGESIVDQAISDLRLRTQAEPDADTSSMPFESSLLVRMADQIDSMRKKLDRLESALLPPDGTEEHVGASVEPLQVTELTEQLQAKPSNGRSLGNGNGKPAPTSPIPPPTQTDAEPEIQVTKPVPLSALEQERVDEWFRGMRESREKAALEATPDAPTRVIGVFDDLVDENVAHEIGSWGDPLQDI